MGLGPPAVGRKCHRAEPDGLRAYALGADPRCVVESLLPVVALPRSHHAPEVGPYRLSHRHPSIASPGKPSWFALIVTMTANYKVVKFATHDTEFPRTLLLGSSVNRGKPSSSRSVERHIYIKVL